MADEMDMLASLLSGPEAFLKKNRIRCVGNGAKSGSSTGAVANVGQSMSLKAQKQFDNELPVPVWYCHMIGVGANLNMNAVDHVHVTSTQPKLVVTGALSGCTVLIEPINKSSFRMAHVQPGGGRGTGVLLENELALGGYMGSELAEIVYGPEVYSPRATGGGLVHQANVIGVAGKNGWEIWAQSFNGHDVKEVRQLM